MKILEGYLFQKSNKNATFAGKKCNNSVTQSNENNPE